MSFQIHLRYLHNCFHYIVNVLIVQFDIFLTVHRSIDLFKLPT